MSCTGQTFTVATLIAAAWAAWWVVPPWPDHCVVLSGFDDKGIDRISANGDSFVWAGTTKRIPVEREYYNNRLAIYELPDGKLRKTIDQPKGINQTDCDCPTGNRLAYCDHEGDWHLLDLPSGDVVKTKLAGDLQTDHSSPVRWSPDGTFLLIEHSNITSVFRTANGDHVRNLPKLHSDNKFLADFSGIVSPTEDERAVVIFRFEPATMPELIELPGLPVIAEANSDGRPKSGTVWLTGCAANADGSRVVALLKRFRGSDDTDFDVSLACWDRVPGHWREFPFAYDVAKKMLPVHPTLTADGRYMTHYVRTQLTSHVTTISPVRNRNLYDLSGNVLRCCNDDGFPGGEVYIDTVGNRIWHRQETKTGCDFDCFDSASLRLLRSNHCGIINGGNLPPAGSQWLTLVEESPSSTTNLPRWLQDWMEKIVPSRPPEIVVIRLSNGAITRRIPRSGASTVTRDGSLWTTTMSQSPDDTLSYSLERWSPEPPTPWWLWALTGIAIMLILRNHGLLRRRRAVSHSTIVS